MRILVVAAHPDDEVLGCGGTIARHAKENDVVIAILGEGATSRSDARANADAVDVSALRQAAENARKTLGAKELLMESLADNRFDELALLDVVKTVERIIVDVKPDLIYTHHTGDLNIDHQITSRAVVTATRPGASQRVVEIISFEIPSSSEWSFGVTGTPFAPNLFIDVSETIDIKIEAMKCYEEEMRSPPHPRSESVLRAIATMRGSAAGMNAAEAFEIVRSLR